VLVLLWQGAADARWISPVFLPGPDRAARALVEGFARGDLWGKLAGTVVRMVWGWLLASVIGVALGATIGVSATARAWLQPMLEFLRPLPASAIVPVAIALLGLSEGMVLTVIAFGALWPMLLGTVHGFAAVEPRLYEVARLLGFGRLQVIAKIALPNALPDIFAGLRIGLTVALILAVVGEMLAGREGLGLWILLSARSFRTADLFAGVILLGLIGLMSASLLALGEHRALRWRTPN
jgi:sulfonate transport system permease protein